MKNILSIKQRSLTVLVSVLASVSLVAISVFAATTIGTNITTGGEARFVETGGGSEYVALKAPAAVTANVTWTLPSVDGTANQTLVTDGNKALSWASGLTTALTSGNIFVGNGSNVATSVDMTGDVDINNTGVTAIGASKVTNTMLAGLIVANKLVGTDIATVGTITAGIWNGTDVAVADGGTGASTAIAGFNALSPVTTLGDIIYRDATNNVRLAGNTTTAKNFLTQTGNSTVSAAPAWGTIAAGDLPTGIDATKLADGSVTSAELQYVGGVTSDIQTQFTGKQGTLTDSAGLLAALSDETGTGLAVFGTSPTLTTPTLGVATATSVAIGGGTAITKTVVYSSSLTAVATAAEIGTTQQTFAVTGLATTDKIIVNGPVPTSLCPTTGYRVSATNTLQLDFTTLTASACTPVAGTYQVVAIRS